MCRLWHSLYFEYISNFSQYKLKKNNKGALCVWPLESIFLITQKSGLRSSEEGDSLTAPVSPSLYYSTERRSHTIPATGTLGATGLTGKSQD